MIAAVLVQPLSEVGLTAILGTLIGGIVMIIRECKRAPGAASSPPPSDNGDILNTISELRGQLATIDTKATAADTKADAAVAVGARTTDRVMNLAAAMPPPPKPPLPVAPPPKTP